MRSARLPIRGAIAAFAALSMILVACDGEDVPEIPGFDESPEETPEDADPDEPAEQDAEATAVPAGAFGPECQRILEAVEHDDAPLAGQDGAREDSPTGTQEDDDATGTQEDGTDDGMTEEDAPTDDGPGDATNGQDATSQLASMSMEEAFEAIPALRPLAQQLGGVDAGELDGGQLTVFAPIDDAIDGATDGPTTGDGPTDEGAGTEDGVGTDEGAGTEDGVGTDEGAGTEDGVGTDEGAGTDGVGETTGDLEALIRSHVHADGALDAAELVQQGTISTLGETTLEVRVETDTTSGTDAGTDEGATEDNGVTDEGATENGLTEENGVTEEGATENGVTEEGATTDEDGATEDGATENGTERVEHLTLIVESDGTQATVLCANIETADGFIHIVDTVLDEGDRAGAEDDGTGTNDEDEEPLDETDEQDTGLGDEDGPEDAEEGALDG